MPPTFRPAPPREQLRDVHYEGWLTLRSPLQHGGDESFGTTRLFRAQKLCAPDGSVVKVPVYNGGAFRGMLRDIAAAQLFDALRVQVPPPVFHFLTSGGTLTGSSEQTIDLGLARQLRDTIPMVSLFGGGCGNQIIEGKTIFLQMQPICRETLHLLPAYCRDAPSAGASIKELRQFDFATRRDDEKRLESEHRLTHRSPPRKDGDVATQQLFETETLVPGTCLRFGFIAVNVTTSEWQALCMALIGFLRKPFLGARSSAGYGEVESPLLFRARRAVGAHQTGVFVDLDRPLATVESVVDPEDRLDLVVERVEQEYAEDVRTRRDEILRTLERIA